uniref:C2H2-type domain-containing protein n=3 Tax=Myripristis murdjan TaxID=586833 RepID=A0A667WIM6_9TELE
MSDLDTLIVTFQTQLSDVMETVVKTAMYEVTRLVEDGFMEEVRRRSQEVESLRTQLQWAERKLSDHREKEAGKRGRCVDCGKEDAELSPGVTDERSKEIQYDILRHCSLKEEDNSVEQWTKSFRQEMISESTQEADKPALILSPVRELQAVEEDVRSTVDVKEEEVDKLSYSVVHPGGWAVSNEGEEGSESHSSSQTTDAQPKQTQQNSDELLRNVIRKDAQRSSTSYVFPEHQVNTQAATDPSHVSPLEVDSKWAGLSRKTTGLLQNHTLDKDCETSISRGSVKRTDQKLADPSTAEEALANPHLVRDQISSSGSPKARLQISDVGSVVIKQEVIVDSDGDEEERVEEKKMKRSGMESFSCSVNQHRVTSGALKQNHISSKPTAQEIMKLHSKVATSLTLQAAVQHLRRPVKKPTNTLSNSSSAAPSTAHSRLANLHPLNRIPSTSKAAAAPPPAPLSVQRAHLGDKQTAALTRTGAPWVSIKSHHHPHALPHPHQHPCSHPQPGPRHLLRCGQCGKCFPHPSNLKAHLQTHTGERPFCCSICGRSFTKLSNLKAHRRVHTGERPYCCLACGKRFTQKCNLKRHQRIHLDV